MIIEDHGGGWKGVSWDDKPNDRLTMAELHQAIGDATKDGAEKLDVIAMDACLMGQLEVAYEIKDYSDFFVGSAEIEPEFGFAYANILDPATFPPPCSLRHGRITWSPRSGTSTSPTQNDRIRPLWQSGLVAVTLRIWQRRSRNWPQS